MNRKPQSLGETIITCAVYLAFCFYVILGMYRVVPQVSAEFACAFLALGFAWEAWKHYNPPAD